MYDIQTVETHQADTTALLFLSVFNVCLQQLTFSSIVDFCTRQLLTVERLGVTRADEFIVPMTFIQDQLAGIAGCEAGHGDHLNNSSNSPTRYQRRANLQFAPLLLRLISFENFHVFS